MPTWDRGLPSNGKAGSVFEPIGLHGQSMQEGVSLLACSDVYSARILWRLFSARLSGDIVDLVVTNKDLVPAIVSLIFRGIPNLETKTLRPMFMPT